FVGFPKIAITIRIGAGAFRPGKDAMPKVRSRLRDYLMYLLVRVAAALVQALTEKATISLAGALAWLAYHFDLRHRQIAGENLRHAFPHWNSAKRDLVLRRTFEHFCLVLLEIARMPRKFHQGDWRKQIELVGVDKVFATAQPGQPAILVSAH